MFKFLQVFVFWRAGPKLQATMEWRAGASLCGEAWDAPVWQDPHWNFRPAARLIFLAAAVAVRFFIKKKMNKAKCAKMKQNFGLA